MTPSTAIVMFAFNRPDMLRRVLVALKGQSARPDHLIVFSDGARHLDDQARVDAVRGVINSVDWVSVELVKRPRNFGPIENILRALDEVSSTWERFIVIEDDVIPAVHFLESMNILLDYYEQEHQVFSVGGFPTVLADALPDYPYDVILSPRFSVWGWGTWSERWQLVAGELDNFTSPYASPEDVPTHAGVDLQRVVEMASNTTRTPVGSTLALISLHQSWLHALSRYYLTNNIGTSSGVHGQPNAGLVRFMIANNQIEERVPARFPPLELREDVCEAVQRYVVTITMVRRRNIRLEDWSIPSLVKYIRTYAKRLLHGLPPKT